MHERSGIGLLLCRHGAATPTLSRATDYRQPTTTKGTWTLAWFIIPESRRLLDTSVCLLFREHKRFNCMHFSPQNRWGREYNREEWVSIPHTARMKCTLHIERSHAVFGRLALHSEGHSIATCNALQAARRFLSPSRTPSHRMHTKRTLHSMHCRPYHWIYTMPARMTSSACWLIPKNHSHRFSSFLLIHNAYLDYSPIIWFSFCWSRNKSFTSRYEQHCGFLSWSSCILC